MYEDMQLCVSYCRQFIDLVFGNKQNIDNLWEKIHIDFQVNWVMGSDDIIVMRPGSQTALSTQFGKLKKNSSFGEVVLHCKNPTRVTDLSRYQLS